MLLNQCLAISLSPAKVPSKGTDEQLEEAGYYQDQGDDQSTSATNTVLHKINQNNAAQLFEQFVEQNKRLATNDIEHDDYQLAQVFARIEFAGFVVPSWMLLSGTFDDLRRLKTSWTRGRLRAPSGLRIETIGNIRSVNVDYLGEQAGATVANQASNQGAELAPIEEQEKDEASTNGKNQSQLASLEKAILSSSRQLEAGQESGAAVQVSQLYANLNNRQPQVACDGKLFEQALKRLVQTGRLKVAGANQLISIPTGRESVSSGSARSKSTTLDSGIQTTWNEHSAASSSAASPTASFEADRDSHQALELQLVMADKSAESARSILEKARGRSLSTRRRFQEEEEADGNAHCGRLEQVIIEDNQQVAAVQQQRQPPEAIKQQARRRGFSLTRSFSFHKPQLQEARQTNESGLGGDIERVAQQAREQTIESSEPQRLARNQPAGANLSSLFRSKSMRVVSQPSGQSAPLCDNDAHERAHGCHKHHRDSHHHDGGLAYGLGACRQDRQTNNCQQATIDYLASAQQQQKRSFSMRRNSLLAFGKEELGGGAGKIALFLRRLFNLRRPSRRQRHSNERQRQQQHQQEQTTERAVKENDHSSTRADLEPVGRLVQVDIVHHHQLRAASGEHSRKNGSNEWQPIGRTKQLNSLVEELSLHQQRHYGNAPPPTGAFQHQLQNYEHLGRATDQSAGCSPDEPHESPPNSLIEILDCSPSLENSRRRLRQEESRNSSASRATWHLIKRSESSLSQQSNASASTNKSTVSQQLRRHLDEAYKRHRGQRGASKRERDFIDSIQVLRQASRHASLENSRASSKNRQASTKSARSHKTVATSAPNTSDDSCSSIASDRPTRFYADDDELELVQQPSAQPDLNTATEWRLNEQQLSPSAAEVSKCEHESQMSRCCCLCSPALQALQAPFAAQSHELYQLACCPVAQQASSQLACCPLAAGHQAQSIALNQSPSHASGLPETSDLCCPIWRSIIYSYCQTQHHQQLNQQHPPQTLNMMAGAQQLAPPPPAPQSPNVIDYQLEQSTPAPTAAFLTSNMGDGATELERSGHTFSASSLTNLQQQQLHHQQQQHNTTIDLKIEIGAELKKKLMGASGRTSASQRRVKQQAAAAAAASSSSAITSDSLDTTNSSSSSVWQEEDATASDSSSGSSSAPIANSTISHHHHYQQQQQRKFQPLKVTNGNQIVINANLCEIGAVGEVLGGDERRDGADDPLRSLSTASLVAS